MKRFLRTTAGKTVTFMLLILTLALTATCIFGVVFFGEQGYYVISKERAFRNMTDYRIKGDVEELVYRFKEDLHSHTNLFMSNYADMSDTMTNIRYAITDENRVHLLTNTDSSRTDWTVVENVRFWNAQEEKAEYYQFSALLEPGLPVDDEYRTEYRILSLIYALRFPIIPVGIVSLILAVVCFVLLMLTAAQKPDSDELSPGPLNRIPFDLLLAASAAAYLIAAMIVWDYVHRSDVLTVLYIVIFGILGAILFTGLCISGASRIKQGNLLSGTFVRWMLKLLWKGLRLVGRGIRMVGHGLAALFGKLPMMWKTVTAVIGISLIEFFFIGFNMYEGDNIMIFWILEHLILIPVIFYLTYCLVRLKKGGDSLAKGDANFIVDTRWLPSDLRRHAQNLNSIGTGLTRAVEQRMKSERMKTELITNVSHDIKTPLTSLISYADLIAKEPCENPKITEYAGVLTRQSERLKRLLDDLVEASKASTGNLTVSLVPTDVGVMLSQAAGEYESRLEAAGLRTVISAPDTPVTILADGRRLWRVFDNLLGNAVKYAQPGTRMYLTLEEIDRKAVITFRNISKEELNLPADELMERFVRGDSSRNAETGGSGLGLSIAQSLTELQHGTFALTVDGDLFKVTLRFPILEGQ